MNAINIFWFRRDLRFDDNTGLSVASQKNTPLLCIFIFDTNILQSLPHKADARVQFIHTSLLTLKQKLVGQGSDLYILYGTPQESFRTLLEKFTIENVFCNEDYEPYALQRDTQIQGLLQAKNISFFSFKDHVIFHKNEILNDNTLPYKVFTPYKKRWIQTLQNNPLQLYPDVLQHTRFLPINSLWFPSLENIGFVPSPITIPPLKIDEEKIKIYDTIKDFPAMEGTTKIGIHLRHGTISIRKAVLIGKNRNEAWLNELIWREFYIMILYNFPYVAKKSFQPQYEHIQWLPNQEHFERWCKGETGYPLVDAGMRELNNTGFMHNRVRMVVASFLTKHLLIDWRLGESYFAEKLLDFDLANNNGGWQWSASTGCDAQPYFRIFNPNIQAQRFDKNFVYIKKWVTEVYSHKYPKPLIDDTFARKRAVEVFSKIKKV